MCYGCYDLAGDIVASQRTAAWATDLGVHHLPIEVAHRYRTQGPQEHPELTKQIRSDGGMREPIVLNTDGVRGYIHDGHHRLDSASSLGMTHVPVRVNRINEELTDYPPLDAHVHGILQGRTAAASLSFHPIPGHDTAIKAWLGDKPVGRIMWAGGDAPDGVPPYQVQHIDIHPDHLRQGVATAMFNHVQQNVEPRLRHSDQLSESGEAFVRSMQPRTAAPIWQKIPSDNTWGEDLDPDLGNDKPLTYSPRQPEDEPSGQWYHVSTQPLKPGTKIIPRGGESPDAGFYDDEGTGYDNTNRQNHVWLAPSAKSAHDWSSSLNAPYIHEVKPGGKPQPWNYSGTNGWVVPHAHVTRQVSREELESRIPRSAPPTGELMQRAREHFPYYMGDGDAKLPRDQWPHQDSPEYAQQVKNFMGDWPQKYPTFDPVGGPFTPHGKPGESHVNRLAELIKHKIPADRNWLDEDSVFDEYDDVPATPVDYSNHDDSVSGDWFHVAPQPLKPGTKIIPGGGKGLHDTAPENWDSSGPLGNRRDHVWLAPNIDKAMFWQSQFGEGARIHHVKPGAKPQPWNMTGSEGFVAPHAHVIGDVTDWANSLPPWPPE